MQRRHLLSRSLPAQKTGKESGHYGRWNSDKPRCHPALDSIHYLIVLAFTNED